MLCAVLAGSVLARALPAIPAPLIQIALGVALGAFTPFELQLNPHIFFLLLVAPLLFVDGWHLPKDALFQYRNVIIGLALGLVFLTVAVMGPVIAWLVPGIPLPVAFALAAALAPTDPLAIGAISRRLNVPPALLHVLEGEGLLNDASALVCLRFAIAVALGGAFDPVALAPDFLIMALGGAGIGVATTWGFHQLNTQFARRLGEDSSADILLSVLVPFIAYLAAEAVHASGVLAAASAGIAMMIEAPRTVSSGTRLRREAVWTMVQTTLNGFVFVLLGQQLLGIGGRALAAASGWVGLAVWIVAISAALLLLRFGWNIIWLRLTLFRKRQALREVGGYPISAWP